MELNSKVSEGIPGNQDFGFPLSSGSLPLNLEADTSMYGVGAVISQTYSMALNAKLAILMHTHTEWEELRPTETLALVFGINNFHQFL